MNKKISFPIAIIIIIILAVLVGSVIVWQIKNFKEEPQGQEKYSSCPDHYTVNCYQDSETIKENIPCSSDVDCEENNMAEHCKPGSPNVLDCLGAKYYCGDDGFCKGCNCPI